MISVLSCEKEKSKLTELSVFVEGDSLNFICNGYRYTDMKDEIPFGFNYHIFNLDSPSLYIEAYDSSFVRDEFYYPKVTAKYAFIDSSGIAVNYHSVEGRLKITKEKKGVLYGTFNFKLTNNKNETDTLEIDKGYFELTLNEVNRVWE